MSGNVIFRHHVETRVKQYSPREESFPTPLKYIDVSGTTRWLLEYRCVKRLVRSMNKFHLIYSIGRKTSKRTHVVRGETDKKAANIQARSFMPRALASRMLERNWKHQRLLLCPAKFSRAKRIVGVVHPIKSKKTCVYSGSWWIYETAYGNSLPNHHEDHIAGKGNNSLQHHNLDHKFPSCASSHENSCSKGSGGH